jgi:hypothetical protein
VGAATIYSTKIQYLASQEGRCLTKDNDLEGTVVNYDVERDLTIVMGVLHYRWTNKLVERYNMLRCDNQNP